MKSPLFPPNEEIRLKALKHLNILDTSEEERFDRLTRLARQMFATKFALISFIDKNRQWVKSSSGDNWAENIPRDLSFCGHTILNDSPLIVANADKDPRFFDNPYVTGLPNIKFYAGYPLHHANGSVLGTLSLIDDQPRTFDDDDISSLKDIADLAERELMAMQFTTQDQLTGLLNEQGFWVLSQNSLNMCERLNAPATIAYFDVRGLKSINQLYGLKEGDNALIFFAELLRFGFRESDVIARLDCDRFAVLLNNTPISNTQEILKRFKERVERYSSEKRLPYMLNYHVGVSGVELDGDYDYHSLLNLAKSLASQSKN
ncbi:diguanylate cyclase [Enterovibrio sp. ZSDZ35]|uniref:Diguanylate cyclase n=1 Tax=Enterovibrio qingdaonensis TaxID=2899818 RepID=A0ABT5QGG0_9GAMM|nr:diguanylate cyclase [Enterovibrio sp. ZSDZ35]MDD1780065.1 diguanylate cyclase [Enterovibrio sp. ZSDZ35]